MSDKKLPPLPPSDKASLERDYKARQFWKGAKIIRIPSKPLKNCPHTFVNKKGGVICTKCNFGLLGHELEARDGKAYAQGKPINFPK